MKKVTIVTVATIVLAVLLGLGGLSETGKLGFVTALNVAETLVITVVHIGICVLFFMGLKAFKAEFKKAYLFICAGILLLATAVLQYTILGSANALDSFWVTSGAIELAFVFSILLLLVGLAIFARLMGVPRLGRYIWVTVLVAVVASAAATQIPSPRTDITAYTLLVTSALYVFQAVMLIAFVPLAYRIRMKTGPLYVPMFAWMFSSFVVYAVQLAVTVFGLFFLPHDHWYVVYGVTMGFFLIAALCLLKAAIELNRIRFTEPSVGAMRLSFFGKPRTGAAAEASDSSVEAVFYLARLSSNPETIDPLLDGLRDITSQLTPGQKPSDEQQKNLAKVYLQIEDYLVNKDQIGKFTQADLRQRVIQKLQDPSEATFWDALKL